MSHWIGLCLRHFRATHEPPPFPPFSKIVLTKKYISLLLNTRKLSSEYGFSKLSGKNLIMVFSHSFAKPCLLIHYN